MLDVVHHIRRNFFLMETCTERLFFPHQRLLSDEVDYATEVFLRTKRQLCHERFPAEAMFDLFDYIVKVRTNAIELVDEHDPRDAILVGLSPDRFRLRLNPADAAENDD